MHACCTRGSLVIHELIREKANSEPIVVCDETLHFILFDTAVKKYVETSTKIHHWSHESVLFDADFIVSQKLSDRLDHVNQKYVQTRVFWSENVFPNSSLLTKMCTQTRPQWVVRSNRTNIKLQILCKSRANFTQNAFEFAYISDAIRMWIHM